MTWTVSNPYNPQSHPMWIIRIGNGNGKPDGGNGFSLGHAGNPVYSIKSR